MSRHNLQTEANAVCARRRDTRRTLPLPWAFAVLAFAPFAFAASGARAADLSAVYRDVKPSVVYIVCVQGADVTSGSGFIYASGDATSMVITSNHVVEGASTVDVILDSDAKHRYQATVVKRDHVRDIAELSIPIGHRIPLKLQAFARIDEGMGIAAIGYPRAAKKFERSLGDDLRPSVHAGIISAVRLDREVLQFDATTDYGDSGGPVIDATSGRVVGIVRGSLLDKSYLSAGLETLPGSNVAMSASSIAAVLADAPLSSSKLAVASAGVASFFAPMPLRFSPNAAPITAEALASKANGTVLGAYIGSTAGSSSAEYRLGFATSHSDDPNGDSAGGALVTRLMDHYKASNDVYVVPAAAGIAEEPPSTLAGYCDDNRLNAIVEPSLRLRTFGPVSTVGRPTRKADVALRLTVMDCSEEPFFVGNKMTVQRVAVASRTPGSELVHSLDGMLNELIGDFDRFRQGHIGAWTSLLKTGIALDPADDRYQSLIGFEQDEYSKDYRVTTVYPGGPGAAAGVQVSDTVVTIDGRSPRGLSRDALMAMLNRPKFTLSVLRPGGPTVLQVEPKKFRELQATLKR